MLPAYGENKDMGELAVQISVWIMPDKKHFHGLTSER